MSCQNQRNQNVNPLEQNICFCCICANYGMKLVLLPHWWIFLWSCTTWRMFCFCCSSFVSMSPSTLMEARCHGCSLQLVWQLQHLLLSSSISLPQTQQSAGPRLCISSVATTRSAMFSKSVSDHLAGPL